MVCPRCGNIFNIGIYCPECGTRCDNVQTAGNTSYQSQNEAGQGYQQKNSYVQREVPYNNGAAAPNMETKKNLGGNLVLKIIGGIVAAIIAIMVFSGAFDGIAYKLGLAGKPFDASTIGSKNTGHVNYLVGTWIGTQGWGEKKDVLTVYNDGRFSYIDYADDNPVIYQYQEGKVIDNGYFQVMANWTFWGSGGMYKTVAEIPKEEINYTIFLESYFQVDAEAMYLYQKTNYTTADYLAEEKLFVKQ